MAKRAVCVWFVLIPLALGCTDYGSSDTILGSWRCREMSSNGSYQAYDVSIEPDNGNDSTRFWVFNFHNLGMDFKVLISLDDSTFTILAGNYLEYGIQGTGVLRQRPLAIDWEYSVRGTPVIQARFEKP